MESYLSRNSRFGPLTRKSYASLGLGTTNLPLEQVPKNIARFRRPSPEKRDYRSGGIWPRRPAGRFSRMRLLGTWRSRKRVIDSIRDLTEQTDDDQFFGAPR